MVVWETPKLRPFLGIKILEISVLRENPTSRFLWIHAILLINLLKETPKTVASWNSRYHYYSKRKRLFPE